MSSEEFLIALQNARRPQQFLIEKTFHVRQGDNRGSKKDVGYTVAATPHTP